MRNLLKRSGLSASKASQKLQQSLLFGEVLSNEIKQTVLERKNKRDSMRRILKETFGESVDQFTLQPPKQTTIDENFQLLHQKLSN